MGTGGFPNLGDELITATWLRYLAQVAPDAEVWVDCASAGPAATAMSGLHPNVRFVDTLWRLCWDAPSDEPWEVATWIQRVVRDPGMTPRWISGIELMARADIVHVIGGGYINAIWPRHIGLLAGAAAAAQRSGGRAVATGQGLVPAGPQVGPLLRSLLAQFELVEVRDTCSAELIGHDGVLQGVDDAFMGVADQLYADADGLPEFMVCMQSDLMDVPRPAIAGLLADTLRAWKASPDNLGIVEGIPRVDREVWNLIEHELPGARFFGYWDVWRGGLPISAHQKWFSSRFHVHLAAAAAGASGVAFSGKPDYYTTKHRSLIDLGSSWTFLDSVDRVPDLPTSGGYAPEQVQAYRRTKLAVAGRIYTPLVRPEPEQPAEPGSAWRGGLSRFRQLLP